MVMNCAVMGCRSLSSVDKVGYYTVPSIITRQDDETREISARRRRLWIDRLGEKFDKKKVNSNTRICGKHFVNGRPARLREQDSVDWLPTIGVHYNPEEIADDFDDESDCASVKHEISSPILWNVDVQMLDEHQVKEEVEENFVYDNFCQTDILSDDLIDRDFHNQIIADNVALRAEITRVKAKICEFTEEQLEGDDSKVKFYTGLHTFSALKHVFELASVIVKYNLCSSLSKFQEFMVVMIRLRLNLLEQDLAFRFGVSQGMISNIMDRWLPVMSNRLRNFIDWPEREFLHKTMPECFKAAFGDKVVVIIDRLEVSFESRPSLIPGAERMSRNKNDSTAMFLIGIVPQGTISFVFRIYGDEASFNIITEKSKILENLLPGDVVLGDDRLTIEESVGMYRAKLSIPTFTKGRMQTLSEQVQAERETDNLKIHVDKVNALLKQEFRILQSTIPLDYLYPRGGDSQCPVDHITSICCALVNLFPSWNVF